MDSFISKKFQILKRRFKNEPLRRADDLFQSGEIFKTSEKELRNILKIVATKVVPNELNRHQDIVRTLIVNNIQNQRHIDKIDNRNLVLTLLIIILTIINIYSAKNLENYIELSTRSERILQEQSIQNAVTRCKNSLDLKESGIYSTVTGQPATCTEVLKNY